MVAEGLGGCAHLGREALASPPKTSGTPTSPPGSAGRSTPSTSPSSCSYWRHLRTEPKLPHRATRPPLVQARPAQTWRWSPVFIVFMPASKRLGAKLRQAVGSGVYSRDIIQLAKDGVRPSREKLTLPSDGLQIRFVHVRSQLIGDREQTRRLTEMNSPRSATAGINSARGVIIRTRISERPDAPGQYAAPPGDCRPGMVGLCRRGFQGGDRTRGTATIAQQPA